MAPITGAIDAGGTPDNRLACNDDHVKRPDGLARQDRRPGSRSDPAADGMDRAALPGSWDRERADLQADAGDRGGGDKCCLLRLCRGAAAAPVSRAPRYRRQTLRRRIGRQWPAIRSIGRAAARSHRGARGTRGRRSRDPPAAQHGGPGRIPPGRWREPAADRNRPLLSLSPSPKKIQLQGQGIGWMTPSRPSTAPPEQVRGRAQDEVFWWTPSTTNPHPEQRYGGAAARVEGRNDLLQRFRGFSRPPTLASDGAAVHKRETGDVVGLLGA